MGIQSHDSPADEPSLPVEVNLESMRKLRSAEGFMALHQFDAYRYGLRLVGKMDERGDYPIDISVFVYHKKVPKKQIKTFRALADHLSSTASDYGGHGLTQSALESDLPSPQSKSTKDGFFDFVFFASFGLHHTACFEFFEKVTAATRGLNVIHSVGRHIHSAIQLVRSGQAKSEPVDRFIHNELVASPDPAAACMESRVAYAAG